MIDNVKLAIDKKYDESLFIKNNFTFGVSKEYKSECYYKTINRVKVYYFIKNNHFIIHGRIINLYKKGIGRVKNFDDIMIEEKVNFNYILSKIEKNIVKIFFPNSQNEIDICLNDFNVNLIEFCINLNVGTQEKVDAYIKMMNLIFYERNDGRYKNYIAEENKEAHTSSYIKANNLYEDNTKKGITINFYNKYNQLSNDKDVIKNYTNINDAKGILRLEVICGSQALNRERKKGVVGFKFKDYKKLDYAYDTVIKKYKRFYYYGDFYTNKEIKKAINESNLSSTIKGNIISKYTDFSKKLGQMFKDKEYVPNTFPYRYNKMLRDIGINPITIPPKFGTPMLECPIKLINKKREILRNITDCD